MSSTPDETTGPVPTPPFVPVSHDSPTIASGEEERFAGQAVTPAEEVESFGPYRVLRKLGEGGFGVVYACEQREPIRRTVALKVIKLGMDTREVIARFEAERQALALMDHPNVARVLDAGVTPRGRPYFVMEYVPGVMITEYCDQARLGMGERLELFVRVCQAVQHAHQKGIIHRDLKPSNVLVMLVDGKPLPKVIDFGIAKATGAQLTERTMFTEAGRLIGTPEYMSPEQAGLSPLDVDTRTDVYALGVLLYELLTGVLPHEPKKLRQAALAEVQRIIREEEPPKPSTRLGQLGAQTSESPGDVQATAVAKIAQRRRIEPGQLVRELRGDLDWITMKAMEKDRGRRYETAAALAADIEHHLRNEPVLAGPPSATYRMRKFARRNRGAVMTAGVFALLVAGAVVALTAAYGLAESERRVAVEERGRADEQTMKAVAEMERADAEAQRAMAAFGFLSDMFASIDPAQAKGREVTVRQMLDDASGRMAGIKDLQPGVEADLKELFATAYHKLAEFEFAERNMRRALEIREKEKGPDSEEALQNVHNLGATVLSRGRFDEADRLLTRAYEGRRGLYGEKNRDTLASKSLLVFVKQRKGDIQGAETMIREVIAAQTELLGPGDRDTIDSRCNLADILDTQGRLEEAEAYTLDLVDTSARALGADDPLTLQAMSIRGSVLHYMGRYEESERVLRATLDAKTRVFGAAHSDTMLTQNIYALTLEQLGRTDEARAQFEKILEESRTRLGREHPQTITAMNNLAQLLRRAKTYPEAEKLYRDALDIQRRVAGDNHVETFTSEVNLGLLLSETDRHEEALQLFRHSLEGLGKALPAGHWKTAVTTGLVGEELSALGRDGEAEGMLREAYTLLAAALGPGHDRTRGIARSLAALCTKLGNTQEATRWEDLARPAAK